MSIPYSYEIIAVDQAARVMEVVYTAEGRQTMHIGARLPYQGESVQAVVQMYAPVAYWLEQEAQVVVPEVGAAGTITPEPPPPPPSTELTVEQQIEAYKTNIQQRLDAFAATRGYDGILSACTYVTSSVPQFAAEAQYAVQARDATWATAYQILAEVQAGTRPAPEDANALVALLPPLQWPV